MATRLKEELEVSVRRLIRDVGQVLPHNVCRHQVVHPGDKTVKGQPLP